MRILRRLLIALAGLLAVLLVALQVLLNSKFVTDFVDRTAAGMIDADLNYSRIHFSILRNFPRVSAEVKDLSITYPHERWAQYDSTGLRDRLSEAGRGASVDTLLSLSEFSASVSPLKLLSGKVKVGAVHIDGLGVYAHSYDSTAANWNIFKPGDTEPDDTTSSSFSLPLISIARLHVGEHPRVVYTSQADTVYAGIRFKDFNLSGEVKIDESTHPRNISARLDSLFVIGRLPADTLAFALDYLKVKEHGKQVFDLGLKSRFFLLTNSFGRVRLPFDLDAKVSYDDTPERLSLGLHSLDADLAHIPVSGKGRLDLYSDSTYVNASLAIKDCKLGEILKEYGPSILEDVNGLSTDAVATLTAEADGWLSDSQIPAVQACLNAPDFHFAYSPMGVSGRLNVDIDVSATPQKYVVADIHDFDGHIKGLDFNLDGSMKDVLGDDPDFDACLKADARLGELMYLIGEYGLVTDGNLKADIDGNATLSEIMEFRFKDAAIQGWVTGDRIKVSLPADSLDVVMDRPVVKLDSGRKGLYANADLDSLSADMGASIMARVRGMKNSFTMSKVRERDRYVPYLAFSNDDGGVFLRYDANRVGLRNVKMQAAAKMRMRPDAKMRKHFLDSLQRVYPGVPKDSLFTVMMRNHRNQSEKLPSYLSEKDFEKKDISIRLDDAYAKYLREWSPSGSFSAEKGFAAVPMLPLRTRIDGIDADFSDNEVNLSKFAITAGTSDINARGSVKGLRRALLYKGTIGLDLDLSSDRLNVNELVAAYEAGLQNEVSADVAEDDESFVIDTLVNAQIDSSVFGLIVIPANVDANMNLRANHVDYSDIHINPLNAGIKVKERCLQITNTTASTNLGDIALDAFYSTQTKKDITAGFNLELSDMSADGIISLLPMVDSLMPAIKSFKGKLNCDLSATTQLDTNMNVVIPSLDGVIRLSGHDLEIQDAGDFRKITKLLLFKNPNIGKIKDFSADAVIHDSKVDVFPFILGVDRYTLALRGRQYFSTDFNYNVSILKSPFVIRFGINLFGNPDDWNFKLCRARYRAGNVPEFTEQIDTIQVNMVRSIRNIYTRGINEVLDWNRRSQQTLNERATQLRYSAAEDDSADADLSEDERAQLDEIQFEHDAEEQNLADLAEVDAIIEESMSHMDLLQKEFDEMMSGKSKKKRKN